MRKIFKRHLRKLQAERGRVEDLVRFLDENTDISAPGVWTYLVDAQRCMRRAESLQIEFLRRQGAYEDDE